MHEAARGEEVGLGGQVRLRPRSQRRVRGVGLALEPGPKLTCFAREQRRPVVVHEAEIEQLAAVTKKEQLAAVIKTSRGELHANNTRTKNVRR